MPYISPSLPFVSLFVLGIASSNVYSVCILYHPDDQSLLMLLISVDGRYHILSSSHKSENVVSIKLVIGIRHTNRTAMPGHLHCIHIRTGEIGVFDS